MSDTNIKNEKVSSSTLAKSGIWYTICTFLFKTVTFLVTPIFARIMTKSEMGAFTNFSSWILILSVLTAFDLQQSIILLKAENEEDMDCYIFSILFLTSIVTLVFGTLSILFPYFFERIFGFSKNYFGIMIGYLFFTPAFQMYITKHRAYYKYKCFVFLTGAQIISSALLSLLLIIFMNNKLTARIIGNYSPYIVIGMVLYVLLAKKGVKIKIKYWKYSMMLCLPLVPHVLSLFLLSSSDKIIISRLCGNELTGMYGMAYNVYSIVVVFFESMNKAWAPWLLENLHNKEYNSIKRNSRYYIIIFMFIITGVMFLAPEIVRVLGGRRYRGTEYCIPPLIASCMFQFIYTMYVNIEFFKKKTIMVSIATMLATVANIVLNFIFIPMNVDQGHVVASYTTLVGYILLFIIHFVLVKKMGMDDIYDTRYIIIILATTLFLMFGVTYTYQYILFRYALIAVFVVISMMGIWKNRRFICAKLYQLKVKEK